MTEILKQGQYVPLTVEKQVMVLFAATNGYCDDIPVKDITRFEKEFLAFMAANAPEIGVSIRNEKKILDETKAALIKAIGNFKETFATSTVKE